MKAAPFVLAVTLVSLLFAGCIASDDPVPEGPDPTATADTEPLMPVITELTGNVGTSFATPVLSFNTGSAYSFPLKPTENTTGYVLLLTWDATEPIHDTLDIWIRDASAGAIPPATPDDAVPVEPVAKATGTSPLRLSVSADQLEQIEYSILVRAGGPAGVAYEQPFDLKVAQFQDLAFDDGFDFEAAGNTTA